MSTLAGVDGEAVAIEKPLWPASISYWHFVKHSDETSLQERKKYQRYFNLI